MSGSRNPAEARRITWLKADLPGSSLP